MNLCKGGGRGESLIRDLKEKANSLSRDTRQASSWVGGGAPPLEEEEEGESA